MNLDAFSSNNSSSSQSTSFSFIQISLLKTIFKIHLFTEKYLLQASVYHFFNSCTGSSIWSFLSSIQSKEKKKWVADGPHPSLAHCWGRNGRRQESCWLYDINIQLHKLLHTSSNIFIMNKCLLGKILDSF